MSRSITDQQWAAARAVSEGFSATHQRIAGIMGVHTTTVSHRAAEDGWQLIDFRHARLRRMQAEIVEMSRWIRAGEALDAADPLEGEAVASAGELEAGLPLEARQMAALERLVALCERIAVMAREQADKARRLGDAELAATYRRVERRIVELACGEALRLLTEVFDILREEIAEKAPRLPTDWAAAEAGRGRRRDRRRAGPARRSGAGRSAWRRSMAGAVGGIAKTSPGRAATPVLRASCTQFLDGRLPRN